MKILLTGANGYVGTRLLTRLVDQGHHVVCCVRDKNRIELPQNLEGTAEILEHDFLSENPPVHNHGPFDVAYFMIHSMASAGDFEEMESRIAKNFVEYLDQQGCEQLIYLSGIVNDTSLSKHLRSRLKTEEILRTSQAHLTVLRAGIIVGSGSASFEIIRDLVEKLPIMIAPRWLDTLCQPIAIRNVLEYLTGVIGNKQTYDAVFDIGGPEVLTYKEMLLQFAEVRGLKRTILTVPVMTPKLSSYWLFFVTSTSYALAVNLVNSMKVDVVVKQGDLSNILKIKPIPYRAAVKKAFQKIEQNVVVSSWKDSLISSDRYQELSHFMQVPKHGVFRDVKKRSIDKAPELAVERFFRIGGRNGWYYANFLWRIRGYLDKLAGGVGLRRGRTHDAELKPGDALDFWRVLVANKSEGRLLLYAEMKLPGEAWLEWTTTTEGGVKKLVQTATFRPSGIGGRLYWYSVLPFHSLIFNGMISKIAKGG